MHRMFTLALVALVVLWAPVDGVLMAGEGEQGRVRGPRFEVTITNLTAADVFTPVLVVSHVAGVRLFRLGSPALVILEELAEGGNLQPIIDLATGSPFVGDFTSTGPVPPGASVTVEVAAGGRFDHVTVASMLLPSNDGFFAANGVEGPRGRDTVTILSPIYDAGTEANDQLCANIPGPGGVCGGEGFNPSRVGAEGFVHVHRGIHVGGELDPATYDWRNPAARITIRRTQ